MMNIKFDSDIFKGGTLLKGSTKMCADLGGKLEKLCSTCGNYKGKLNCQVIGKIKNPNTVIYCSWWKVKKVKLNNIRDYRSLK